MFKNSVWPTGKYEFYKIIREDEVDVAFRNNREKEF